MTTVKKLFPTPEECQTINFIKCNEQGCSSVFKCESNLTLHLVKSHKKAHLWQHGVTKHYYCPELNCPYNMIKYFKNMKCLRQHYLKVHTFKEFICELCKKAFSSQPLFKSHVDYCGISFKCCDCSVFYDCYETLKTHGRRKKHTILNKTQYKMSEKRITPEGSNGVDSNYGRPLLPKPSPDLVVVVTPMDSKIVNQGVQTEKEVTSLKNTMTQVNRDMTVQITQQTQTGTKNVVLSTETQTVGNFTRKPSLIDTIDPNRKNSETQTNQVLSKSQSSNTCFNLDDFEFERNFNMEKNSSSTQTGEYGIYSSSTTTHDSIHTDTSDLLSQTLNLNNFDESSFFNCNMETQTDLLMENDLLNYCDYYSNMYTQTCDDVLSGLGFNDTETQTVYDDILKSVEIQTMMSHVKKNNYNPHLVANTQTQTDIEFKQMLEEINS